LEFEFSWEGGLKDLEETSVDLQHKINKCDNYLIYTCLFLETLLNQEKKELCKDYLNSKFGQIVISDFSLHSIGVILFKNKRFEIYSSFINDVLPRIKIITLPKENYPQVRTVAEQFNLDFDDAYQVTVAGRF
jgi:uncharacterized protein